MRQLKLRKMNNDREKVCEYCKEDAEAFSTSYMHDLIICGSKLCIQCEYDGYDESKINYCPMCGRKLRGGR